MRRQAILLDRDGTLIHLRHYPKHPHEIVLHSGIGVVLATLQHAGFLLVMVTNQSGIARGYFDEDALRRVHAHLAAQLAAEGVALDGIYVCPHYEAGSVERYAHTCSCRKPQPGMLLTAATDLDIDLSRSWMVGDSPSDIIAGMNAGCRTVLVDLGTKSRLSDLDCQPTFIARDTLHALQIIRAEECLGPTVDREYQPTHERMSALRHSATFARPLLEQGGD